MNGDGLPDRVMAVYNQNINSNWFVVDLSKGPFPDLLTTANNGIGGSVTVTYQPSTIYNNHQTTNVSSAGLLPLPFYTVSSAAVSDGMYPAYTNSYSYDGGYYDF